jgi:hypothetical protein
MDALKSSSGSMTLSLLILTGLLVLALVLATQLRESELLTGRR